MPLNGQQLPQARLLGLRICRPLLPGLGIPADLMHLWPPLQADATDWALEAVAIPSCLRHITHLKPSGSMGQPVRYPCAL